MRPIATDFLADIMHAARNVRFRGKADISKTKVDGLHEYFQLKFRRLCCGDPYFFDESHSKVFE
jgi:hypothetical protein